MKILCKWFEFYRSFQKGPFLNFDNDLIIMLIIIINNDFIIAILTI